MSAAANCCERRWVTISQRLRRTLNTNIRLWPDPGGGTKKVVFCLSGIRRLKWRSATTRRLLKIVLNNNCKKNKLCRKEANQNGFVNLRHNVGPEVRLP